MIWNFLKLQMSNDAVVLLILLCPTVFFCFGILNLRELLADQTPPKKWEVLAHFVASFVKETLSIKQCVFGNVARRVDEHLTEPFTNEKKIASSRALEKYNFKVKL